MTKKFSLILSFIFVSVAAGAQKKVLFVMSAASELPLKKDKVYKETGVFLSEFYLAYKAIAELGYEIDFATPDGIKSPIDKESLRDSYWGEQSALLPEARDFVREDQRFNNPYTLEYALENAGRYTGLVIPGGQGLMSDLFYDRKVSGILKEFREQGKPIGLVCHAPALILAIPREENPFIGYTVNSVTGLEECFIETFVMKGKPANRKIGRQLRKFGLIYRKGKPKANFALRDRMLITSQNPYSNKAFTSLYLEALKEYELKGSLR